MATTRKSPGDPEFLTNGGLPVVTIGFVLAVVIDYLLSRYGNWQGATSGPIWILLVPYLPFNTGAAMAILTVVLWAGGHLRRRWQFWIGEAHQPPLLWTERPFWRPLKLVAVALAIMALLPTFFAAAAASLAGGPRFEDLVESYFYSLVVVAPSFVTCLLGFALADLLLVANVATARGIASGQDAGQTMRGVLLSAVYLFVVFDVVLLLPRSFIELFASKKAATTLSVTATAAADLAVAATAPLLVVWAAIAWLRGRRRPR